MTCPKCAATMIRETPLQFHAMRDMSETEEGVTYRCMMCGTYLDAVILKNRAKQRDERRLLETAETIAAYASLRTPQSA